MPDRTPAVVQPSKPKSATVVPFPSDDLDDYFLRVEDVEDSAQVTINGWPTDNDHELALYVAPQQLREFAEWALKIAAQLENA